MHMQKYERLLMVLSNEYKFKICQLAIYSERSLLAHSQMKEALLPKI